MSLRPARRTHGLAVRLLVGTTAGLAVVASSATGAMAEDAPPTEEAGPSTLVLEPEESTADEGSSTAPDGEPVDPEAPTSGTGASESVVPGSEAAETEVDGDAAEVAPPAGPADEAAQPLAIAPIFGEQKVRIGVQQADGSYIDPDATLVGTTMSITITGGVDAEGDPLATETTSCVVESEFGDDSSRSATCEVGDGLYLFLDAGRTATITPTVVPAGVVLAPASQVVQPCLIGECVPFPSLLDVEFSATGTPVAVSAATTAGVPVTIDVVAPLVLAPDNAVNGVSVTQQSASGTAVVTGDLPPVPEEPVVPGGPFVPVDETALVAAAAPVTAQAPSGTSRIVFTPAAGFVGTTTFGYAVATQNGTITGTATVTVAPAPVVTPPAVTPPVATPPTGPAGAGNIGTANRFRFRSSTGNLPSTGGPAEELLAVGALLVVAGAGAMAARRRTERDLVG